MRHHVGHLDAMAWADWTVSFKAGMEYCSSFLMAPCQYMYTPTLQEVLVVVHFHLMGGSCRSSGQRHGHRWISQLRRWFFVVAAAMWGQTWHQHRVFFHSDNAAVVAVIQNKSARQPSMLHLLRCLYFFAAYYHFSYSVHHLPGVTNAVADALSRNNMSLFISLVSQDIPTEVSQEVSDLFRAGRYTYI